MPPDVRDKAESADRYWYFLVDALTIAFVPIGMAAGAIRALLLNLLAKLFPSVGPDTATGRLRTKSVPLWIIIFFTGAFSEELWIAFCLVVLRMASHSTTTCVAFTAIVFGAVHFEYRFGAIVTAMYGVLSALLFLWLGSLIPMFLFHFIGNLGSLYSARRAVL
jgi:membrane protease YdiL (CAAX protease family)